MKFENPSAAVYLSIRWHCVTSNYILHHLTLAAADLLICFNESLALHIAYNENVFPLSSLPTINTPGSIIAVTIVS